MKPYSLFLFFIFAHHLSGQIFTPDITATLPFEGVSNCSIAFSDVDNDGDSDVLITGQNNSEVKIAKLYINDGMSNFTEKSGTPFVGVEGSSIAFSDVDSDGDSDVLITGRDNYSKLIARLYTNDGMGNFTEMTGTPFEGVFIGSIAFSDVDGDGDSDVLIAGSNTEAGTAKLYTNDGMGNFTEMTGTPFMGVFVSSIAFSDVDGDGDSDVFITGQISTFIGMTKLYINDGEGNYSVKMGTPFRSMVCGSVAFSDVDVDGDSDILLTGSIGFGCGVEPITKLYINDGLGNYTELFGVPFEGVDWSSIAFSDVDNDGDPDILIAGNNSETVIAKLYINDGEGNFIEKIGTPFEGVERGSIAFSDVDSDGDADILISGSIASEHDGIAKLYINDGLGNFKDISGTPFEGVERGSIAFSDVDGDGDSDVLITGADINFDGITELFTNDGMGIFTEMTGTPFEGVTSSSIAFSDVDSDGDSDVLITGRVSNRDVIAKLYINDGIGNFAEMTGTPFEGVSSGSIAFSDVDGDGDSDVLITGTDNNVDNIAKLYTNNGMGDFTEKLGTPFEGVDRSSTAFSDVDGDGDFDILITGRIDFIERIAKLYSNDGLGNFTEITGTPFEGVSSSSIAFSDVDSDGDSDVLITGADINFDGIGKLYTNDGMGNFTEITETPFEGVSTSSIAFSDVDGDGDSDVLITGADINFDEITKLYTNDGMGNFTEITETPFEGVSSSSIAFSDVDGDGDSDVLITGKNTSEYVITKLFTNNGNIISDVDYPTNLGFKFEMYPNPTEAQWINVRFVSEKIGFVRVIIYDLNGRIIGQQSEFLGTGEQSFSLDIANFKNGAYILQIDSEIRKGAQMFIIQ